MVVEMESETVMLQTQNVEEEDLAFASETKRLHDDSFECLSLGSWDLSSAEDAKERAVWLAWLFAGFPGLGLGHLYAGMTQIFLYLVFLSVLGVLFFHITGSYASFLLILFSWGLDLGFAAYHVKQHNRRADRLKRSFKRCKN